MLKRNVLKTEAEQFREIFKGKTFRHMKVNSMGNILEIETTDPAMIIWLKAKGLKTT